ncbi:type I-C CRISPR-associated protein Cas7/Csd2 [Paenirhodobacter sp. CAU 1674]|uniref:type I-C CRISPR-associated protein Cas7/Csd2 n=1 Tax=Paenirhodobacter sp. CAU 1674 TaxID=3032596 RepID=UPI0023D98F99|nr:type I-C CRISPR-associated protein Cas7/Csd2 [Paenirhodobacter sp. CAU 1674]MDF2140879.1 type I-C CRISPR-associated protein Cas7/Csd2 [Paenirhodobacter sp. CAU 1674]
MTTLSRRHDFVLIFDVTDGNPNGDPDAGNLPRLDPETNHGLVSDVSLKRKIRNYVDLARTGQEGHHIYVQEGAILNEKHRQAYVALRGDEKSKKDAKLNPKNDDEAKALRDFMCANFFDVRTFGAVMSTGINCGQVKGPVQMTFSRSVEPILPVEVSITRMAATNEAEQKKRAEGDDSDARTENRTMGRKHIVPYGLYVAHGFVSAKFAEQTGFSEADLDLLFEALSTMFEHDRSAARGEMTTRKLIVFAHDNALGNAPSHKLFERVRIGRNVDGELRDLDDKGLGNLGPARKFSDYLIEIDRADLPAGVEIREIV